MKKYVQELNDLEKEAAELSAAIHVCEALMKEIVPIIVDINFGDGKPRIGIDPTLLLSYINKRLEFVKKRIQVLEDAFVTAGKVVRECIKNPMITVEAKNADNDQPK